MHRILKTKNKTRKRLLSLISLHRSKSWPSLQHGIGKHAFSGGLSPTQTHAVQICDPTKVQTYPTGCLCKVCSVKYCCLCSTVPTTAVEITNALVPPSVLQHPESLLHVSSFYYKIQLTKLVTLDPYNPANYKEQFAAAT